MRALLADFKRAWESFQSLAQVTSCVFGFSFTPATIIALDQMTYDHHLKFLAVDAYVRAGLWKPKQNFTQLIAMEVKLFGPPRGTYCMMFEFMNQVMKRFATSGDWTDVAHRAAQMWDRVSAWDLITGRLAHFSDETMATQVGTEFSVQRTKSTGLAAYLFRHIYTEALTLGVVPVFQVLYLGQKYELGTYLLFSTWKQWLDDVPAQLGFVESMVQLSNGEIFVRIQAFDNLQMSKYWTAASLYTVPKNTLYSGSQSLKVLRFDELAITKLNLTSASASELADLASFTVEFSSASL